MTPRGLLIDIDGVLVVSWEPLPGAVDAFRTLRDGDVPVRLLTNTTSRTRAAIVDALCRVGLQVGSEEVLTATTATAHHLAQVHPGARCLLLSSGDVRQDLAGVTVVGPGTDPAEVDVVVVGGAGDEFTYAALNHALACLLAGAHLVAMHTNVVWRTRSGMQLDSGAFVVGLERAAGVTATVVGKPAPAMFEAALRSMGLSAAEVAMVGDDLDSDVRAAQRLGITGVQVRTGKFRDAQLAGGPPPDVLLGSFADVPGWWAAARG